MWIRGAAPALVAAVLAPVGLIWLLGSILPPMGLPVFLYPTSIGLATWWTSRRPCARAEYRIITGLFFAIVLGSSFLVATGTLEWVTNNIAIGLVTLGALGVHLPASAARLRGMQQTRWLVILLLAPYVNLGLIGYLVLSSRGVAIIDEPAVDLRQTDNRSSL